MGGRPRGAAIAAALFLCLSSPVAGGEPDEAAAAVELAGGEASYFGAEMAGNRTASGEPCDPETLTAAHRTLPLGSHVRVTDSSTGNSVVVRVNDRGPFTRGRVIDLSRAAARKLGMLSRGHARVELAKVPAQQD